MTCLWVDGHAIPAQFANRRVHIEWSAPEWFAEARMIERSKALIALALRANVTACRIRDDDTGLDLRFKLQ